jgi:hypothetical protein
MPDPILFWNQVALEANRVSHTNGLDEQTGPTRSSRALAIVHLAMYDAYAGVDTAAALPPYITGLSAPGPGATVEAAVAAAAHATLSSLFRVKGHSLTGFSQESVPRPIRGMPSGLQSPQLSLPIEQATPAVPVPATRPLLTTANIVLTPTIPARVFMVRSMASSRRALPSRSASNSLRLPLTTMSTGCSTRGARQGHRAGVDGNAAEPHQRPNG